MNRSFRDVEGLAVLAGLAVWDSKGSGAEGGDKWKGEGGGERLERGRR